MKWSLLLMASIALTLLFASGVALALTTINCDGGECKGTTSDDEMLGTSKRDIMYGIQGNDKLYGRSSSDDLYGFGGNDQMYGGVGNDKLYGSNLQDHLYGSSGSDLLGGGDAQDDLVGGAGDDEVYGGPGNWNDVITVVGGDGADLLDGGEGDDKYFFAASFSHPGAGWHATISDSDSNPATPDEAVSGRDRLYFYGPWRRDLTITLNTGPGPEVTDDAGNSTIQLSAPGEFYSVIGGVGDDVITGDEWPNSLWGADGSDTINGGGGNDKIVGSSSSDSSISGGKGKDFIDLNLRNQDGVLTGITTRVQGEAGDDYIHAHNGFPDDIDCGEGTDTVDYDVDIDTVVNCETLSGKVGF